MNLKNLFYVILFALCIQAQAQTEVVAHRGFWKTDGSAQNSINSLLKADSIKAYGSEVDVWLSSDGVPVVNHDAHVILNEERLTVQDTPASTLAQVKLQNGENLPTFENYLDAFEKCKHTKLILEFKKHRRKYQEDELTEKVLKMVRDRNLQHRVEYISFSINFVVKTIHLDPLAKVYYLNGDLSPQVMKEIGAAGIDYNISVIDKYPEWVKLSHDLGLKVNAMPFEQLAIITPFSLIRKNRDSEEELQALLLGQAGFLDEVENDGGFMEELKSTYALQRLKYGLTPMPASAWKLFRLRPQNFPAVRIAQMARILTSHHALAQQIIELTTLDEYEKIFESSLDKGFWLNHYTLKTKSEPIVKNLGRTTVHLLLINGVVPFLFALASYNKNGSFQEKAVSLLEQLPAEKNQIIKKFADLGFKAKNAFDSQGLIGLKKNNCELLKCLTCKVGIQILKNHGQAH